MVKIQRPPFETPVIKTDSFPYTYYKQFQHLYIDPNSNLIHLFTPNSRVFEEIFIKTQPSFNQTRVCYHSNSFMLLFTKLIQIVTLVKNFRLKPTVFKPTLGFNQLYYIPHVPLWFLFSFMIVLNVKQTKHY